MTRTLISILGDQLSLDLSSLNHADPATSVILMMEVADETTYVRHHKRKIAYILSAMRHHAEALRAAGCFIFSSLLRPAMYGAVPLVKSCRATPQK